MNIKYQEILTLCSMMEAEIDGRAFDQAHALDIATRMSQEFPEIRYSVQQICNRIGEALPLPKTS